jgi:hypothetical protein
MNTEPLFIVKIRGTKESQWRDETKTSDILVARKAYMLAVANRVMGCVGLFKRDVRGDREIEITHLR